MNPNSLHLQRYIDGECTPEEACAVEVLIAGNEDLHRQLKEMDKLERCFQKSRECGGQISEIMNILPKDVAAQNRGMSISALLFIAIGVMAILFYGTLNNFRESIDAFLLMLIAYLSIAIGVSGLLMIGRMQKERLLFRLVSYRLRLPYCNEVAVCRMVACVIIAGGIYLWLLA